MLPAHGRPDSPVLQPAFPRIRVLRLWPQSRPRRAALGVRVVRAAAAVALRPGRDPLPETTPEAFVLAAAAFGAEVQMVPGTIADAGKALATWAPAPAWWNVSTFKEPFRLEGKKTLGYELAEQGGWRLPDLILYP